MTWTRKRKCLLSQQKVMFKVQTIPVWLTRTQTLAYINMEVKCMYVYTREQRLIFKATSGWSFDRSNSAWKLGWTLGISIILFVFECLCAMFKISTITMNANGSNQVRFVTAALVMYILIVQDCERQSARSPPSWSQQHFFFHQKQNCRLQKVKGTHNSRLCPLK